VVLTIKMSSKVSGDATWCCWGIVHVSRVCSGFTGEAGGNWRDGERLWNEMGQLGLGAHQFGLSE
jgi:hypothetical protein